MARKVRTQVAVEKAQELVSVDSGVVTMDRVRFKGVDSRRLVTIGPDHPMWVGNETVVMRFAGAIVRLEPPAGVTEAYFEAIEKSVRDMGAVAIRVGHRQRADAVITQVEKAQPAKGESVHQVVMSMVEEAKAGDKDSLRNLIEAALAAEGL